MYDLDAFNLSLTNHKPTEETVTKIERLRSDAKRLGLAIFRECPPSRERSLAITALEESVMWGVKSIVLPRQGTLA